MRKICLALLAIALPFFLLAQTVTNAGMESWRTGTAGSVLPKTIHAPIGWYGNDSLVIGVGQSLIADTNMSQQLFEEDSIVHSGAHSAKIMTKYQDTLKMLPGLLTNAQISFNIIAILLGGSPSSAISFSGGEPVTLKITTVSAYVAYFPGIDTATHLMGGADTGLLTVEAYGVIGGVDSLLGTGFVQILPSDTFTQITANIAYTDTVDSVGLVRIFFSSSGGTIANLDSSTLYVDDVTMTGIPEPIPVNHTGVHIVAPNDIIKVYPNPAAGTLYFDCPQNMELTVVLYAVNGGIVAAKSLTGNYALDVTELPAGLYFYSVFDKNENVVQRGKVAVTR